MHPGERVRFAVETARAVLEERLAADEGAAAIKLQAEQGHSASAAATATT